MEDLATNLQFLVEQVVIIHLFFNFFSWGMSDSQRYTLYLCPGNDEVIYLIFRAGDWVPEWNKSVLTVLCLMFIGLFKVITWLQKSSSSREFSGFHCTSFVKFIIIPFIWSLLFLIQFRSFTYSFLFCFFSSNKMKWIDREAPHVHIGSIPFILLRLFHNSYSHNQKDPEFTHY